MITKEQRDEMRRRISALDGTNYAIDCYGVGHVEAAYIPAVANLKSLLDALDEMERERDTARLQHNEALDRVRGAMARADAALDGMLWRARLGDKVLAYFSDVSVAEQMTRGMDASGVLVERII